MTVFFTSLKEVTIYGWNSILEINFQNSSILPPPLHEKQPHGKENRWRKSRLRQRLLSSKKCTCLPSDQLSCSFLTITMIHSGPHLHTGSQMWSKDFSRGLQSDHLRFPSANHTLDMKHSTVASGQPPTDASNPWGRKSRAFSLGINFFATYF